MTRIRWAVLGATSVTMEAFAEPVHAQQTNGDGVYAT